jgi:hypothetical protein
MDVRDTGCENGNWIDWVHAYVLFRAFIFVRLDMYVMLPMSESVWLLSNVTLTCINFWRILKFFAKEFYF